MRQEKALFHFDLEYTRRIIRENKHFIVPEILDNLGQDAQVLWTIFLILTSLTVLDIGILGVIAGLVGMVVTHITGRLIDTSSKQKIVRYGAVATTITWAASYFIAIYMPTPLLLYIITTLRGFALGIFASAYGVIMFNRARKSDAQFIVLREIPTVVGRIVVFAVALFLASTGRLEMTFLVVTIISLYFWFNDLKPLMTHSSTDTVGEFEKP